MIAPSAHERRWLIPDADNATRGLDAGSLAVLRLSELDDQVIDLTKRLIAARSPNPPGNEQEPVRIIQEAAAGLGLPTARIVGRSEDRPNFILTISGEEAGPHLAFCGHTDTKPVGDAAALWRTDPYVPEVVGDRLYGLGSTDMKGAVAAMLFAAVGLQEQRERLRGSVSFLFTADEEHGSHFGAGFLVEAGLTKGIDAVILGEPSGLERDWEAIRTVSRGVACFRVKVHGTQMHSSISDVLPSVSAVEAMARLMTAFRAEFRPRFQAHPLCPSGPTVNVGVHANGGVGWGVIAGEAEFWVDVRTIPGMAREELSEDISAAFASCDHTLDGATADFAFDPEVGWSDATEIEPGHPAVVASLQAAAKILGTEPKLAYFPGGTDAIAFQAIAGIPTVASFGPGLLPLAHAPNEWVSCTAVQQAMRMYAYAGMMYGSLAIHGDENPGEIAGA